jgi:hypothetical protein
MADLIEIVQWEDGIYQLEEDDPVLGGPGGVSNLQARMLANRTAWLKEQIEAALAAIDDFDADPMLPTGSIIYVPSSSAPPGSIKATGPLLSRVTYAGLWAYAQASGNLVSEAAWADRPGSFSTGDGTNTFRAPLIAGLVIKGFHDGLGTYETDTARALGSFQGDAIRNITGTFYNDANSGGYVDATGPFSRSGSGGIHGASQYAAGSRQITFNAGAVVPTAADNRVRNVALLPVIYY